MGTRIFIGFVATRPDASIYSTWVTIESGTVNIAEYKPVEVRDTVAVASTVVLFGDTSVQEGVESKFVGTPPTTREIVVTAVEPVIYKFAMVTPLW